MPAVCIYLQVHQPYRVKRYGKSAIGRNFNYFNGHEPSLDNGKIFKKVSEKSYLPTNKILLGLLKKYKNFKIVLSFSGTALEQMENFAPQVLRSFQKLHQTGKVEILSETYYHSLAFFYSQKEFEYQVKLHKQKIKKLFGVTPMVFRNTELAYNNKLAKWAEKNKYKGIIIEGWEHCLRKRSPNLLYYPRGISSVKLLLKNYHLSDDIAFRFSNKYWHGWPLGAKKFARWITSEAGDTVNLFMDYETFGEHQWKETGIFSFLRSLPGELLKQEITFKTATEAINTFKARGSINVPNVLTWADSERDLSAWTGNKKQKKAIKLLYDMEEQIIKSGNQRLMEDWRKLQSSDHFYYMSTKKFDDGGVHDYFSPYKDPRKAYEIFMNVLSDLKIRIKACKN